MFFDWKWHRLLPKDNKTMYKRHKKYFSAFIYICDVTLIQNLPGVWIISGLTVYIERVLVQRYSFCILKWGKDGDKINSSEQGIIISTAQLELISAWNRQLKCVSSKVILVWNSLFVQQFLYCSSAKKPCRNTKREFHTE